MSIKKSLEEIIESRVYLSFVGVIIMLSGLIVTLHLDKKFGDRGHQGLFNLIPLIIGTVLCFICFNFWYNRIYRD